MDINVIKEDYVKKNLYREARILSQLNHPCIAALYQTMQRSDKVYYLVNELVSGGDLCSFIKAQRNGKLDEKSTKNYGRQFASALAHMHGLGIVHRDLKMENVMLNALQTQIKIVDFGLSNVWSPSSPLRTHCGSPEYAAPELFITGREYGPEVDLWSLGIILYGMVVGQLPFVSHARGDQASSQERRKRLVAQINKGLAAPQRRMLTAYSPDFRAMMCRLLVADSSKRITVTELLVHPWITEKGTRGVRANPIRKPDLLTKAKIYRDIGTLADMETADVEVRVLGEPLGPFGGMYNILVHKLSVSMLKGDGVTRVLTAPFNSRPISVQKEFLARSSASSRPESRKQAPQSASPKHLSNATSKASSRLSQAKTKAIVEEVRPKSSFPSNVGRVIRKSSLPKRQIYSASGSRPPKGSETEKPRPKNQNKNNGIISNAKGNEVHVAGTRGIPEALNYNKQCQKGKTKGNSATAKVPVVKVLTKESKSHTKSDISTGLKRPISVPSPSDRSAGRPNVSSVTYSQSVSKTTTKKFTAPVKGPTKKPSCIENHPQSRGDGNLSKRPRSPKPAEPRKPVIYDPIARSIADYLSNNVSDKIRKIRWPKNCYQ